MSQPAHFEAVRSFLQTSNSPLKSPSNFEEPRAFRSSLEETSGLRPIFISCRRESFALPVLFRPQQILLFPSANFSRRFKALHQSRTSKPASRPFHGLRVFLGGGFWSRPHFSVTSRLFRITSDIASACQVSSLVFDFEPASNPLQPLQVTSAT